MSDKHVQGHDDAKTTPESPDSAILEQLKTVPQSMGATRGGTKPENVPGDQSVPQSLGSPQKD